MKKLRLLIGSDSKMIIEGVTGKDGEYAWELLAGPFTSLQYGECIALFVTLMEGNTFSVRDSDTLLDSLYNFYRED